MGPSGSMASPVGKREPKVDIQLPQYSGVSPRWPTWVLTHDGHRSLQGLISRDQIEAEKGNKAYSHQSSELGGSYTCLSKT